MILIFLDFISSFLSKDRVKIPFSITASAVVPSYSLPTVNVRLTSFTNGLVESSQLALIVSSPSFTSTSTFLGVWPTTFTINLILLKKGAGLKT